MTSQSTSTTGRRNSTSWSRTRPGGSRPGPAAWANPSRATRSLSSIARRARNSRRDEDGYVRFESRADDETRGERIKAFLELAGGVDGDDALRDDLRDRARTRLAEYEYPREVEFVDELPMTSTGKIRRVELRERGDG
jgi:acyl-coenzyme A synthetase/AMP-(fatty) acid ligase